MLQRRAFILLVLAIMAIGFAAGGFLIPAANAAIQAQDVTPTPQTQPTQPASPTPEVQQPSAAEAPEQLSISNEVCLSCHGKEGLTMKLGDGTTLDLYVAPDDYKHSIHGQENYACVQCHRQVGNYPHPAFSAENARDVTLKLNNACQKCHSTQYHLTQDSVHAAALAKGNNNAAVCSDCHTAHAVRQLIDPKTQKLLPDARAWIPQTCARCHSTIYNEYKNSVHGSALLGDGNPDVPTCIDCHGVHNIQNPTTTTFRIQSPSVCAKCHTDPKIMNKYHISTDVLSTYVADFHGTTNVLFGPQSPDSKFNEPVCYDCHGVHNIAKPDDPVNGLALRQNLLKRCQQCHPDANLNYPRAWLSHYVPSANNNRLVYYVNMFYKILIPLVIGGMAFLVVLDFSRRNLNRYRSHKHLKEKAAEEQAPVEQAVGEQPGEAPEISAVEEQAAAELTDEPVAEEQVEALPVESAIPEEHIEPPAVTALVSPESNQPSDSPEFTSDQPGSPDEPEAPAPDQPDPANPGSETD